VTAPIPILLVITSSDLGGTENFLRQLATGLDRNRFSPHVCTLRPAGAVARQIAAAGVPISSFDMAASARPGEMIRARQRLRDLALEQGTRIVQSLLYRANLLTVATFSLARYRGEKPILVGGQRSLGAFTGVVPERVLRWCRPRFDHTVAVSPAVRERLIAEEGLDAQKLSVIGNGVDTNRFAPLPLDQGEHRRALRLSLGVTDNDFLIGSAGRLSEKKRYHCLIEAIEQLRGSGLPVKLCIAGEGEERVALEQLIEAHELDRCVRLLGARDDLDRLYRAFDLFVLPSREEGSPNALIEAMACGVPAVATLVGGVADIITTPEVAVAIEAATSETLGSKLADVCAELIQDPEKRQRLAAAGRRHVVDEFSHRHMIEQHEELYLRLLGARLAARP
jgi:glycosyltransferase involved in cell wall biosynthesis